MAATKTLTNKQFYKYFPWIFELPLYPQCTECLRISYYKQTADHDHKGEQVKITKTLIEQHHKNCSRYIHHDKSHVVIDWESP